MTRRGLARDAGLALLVLSLSLVMLAQGGLGTPSAGTRALDRLGVALLVLASLPLAARRLAPLVVYTSTAAASLALLGLGYPLDFPLSPLVAVYTLADADSVAARPPRRWAALLAVAAFVPATAGVFAVRLDDRGRIVPSLAIWALAGATLWLAGGLPDPAGGPHQRRAPRRRQRGPRAAVRA